MSAVSDQSDARIDSLVLYKGQPAIIRQITDKKITIESADGERTSVRPKDVSLLHPGPSPHPNRLKIPDGDPQTAWELLDGAETSLDELAELSFGEYTPHSAWAAWQLIADGVYFEGTPEKIHVHAPAKVAEILAARESKMAEEREWGAFVTRTANGSISPDDEKYIGDVIALALGRTESSRTLRRLGRSQTPESAHELLLSTGRWRPSDNPYPSRQGVTTGQPDFPIGPLPDEPRRDLSHLLSLAIDDSGSNDPDDAISLDGDVLWVHVADTGALVEPDSPSDLEARFRAASLYLPEGIVRMLPDALTDMLALGLQETSPALSFALKPDSDGDFELLEITPSRIRVTRMTYEAAEEQLDTSPLRELMKITERNRARRLAGGAVEIDLPEVKIKAAVNGEVIIRPLPSLQSRELVREAMLMAGEAVGRFGVANEIPLSYTVQEPPLEDESLPKDLTGATPSIMWAQRRLMQRSRPSTAPGRHSGLGLDVYVQVTSPLRRYLDLLAHQQIRAHLKGEQPLTTAEVTQRIGAADSIAGAVRTTERLSNQHWTLVYLLQHADWQGEAIVVENKPGRDVLLIPELAWETEIYRRPSQPLDSVVVLSLDSVDLPNRTAHFKII